MIPKPASESQDLGQTNHPDFPRSLSLFFSTETPSPLKPLSSWQITIVGQRDFPQPHKKRLNKTATNILPKAMNLWEAVDPDKQKDKRKTSLQQQN